MFGTILPALGIALLIGNVYYTYLARRLARRENRTDVTAMPYGPSVPHMFIVVFVIMLPIYLKTNDPMHGLGGRAGLGVHHRRHRADRRVRRAVHPQVHAAGGDARHAGRHLDHVHLDAARRADVGGGLDRACRSSAIILVGFFTDLKLPGNIPVGLAALLVGTAIGWIGGYMSAPGRRSPRRSDIAISPADASTSTCSVTGSPTSPRCWPPRSRWASTTSPRR